MSENNLRNNINLGALSTQFSEELENIAKRTRDTFVSELTDIRNTEISSLREIIANEVQNIIRRTQADNQRQLLDYINTSLLQSGGSEVGTRVFKKGTMSLEQLSSTFFDLIINSNRNS